MVIRITVGKSKVLDKKTNEKRVCKYSDVPQSDGWVLNEIYFPIPYDLLFLRIRGMKKSLSGWWNGRNWYGNKLKKDHDILAWKRNLDDRI